MILSTLLFLACHPAPTLLVADDGFLDAAIVPPENVTRGTFLSPHATLSVPIHLHANDPTVVQVLGSGTTDLDADLFDEKGQRVALERGPEDRAWFEVIVPEARTYTLRVRNLGPWTNDVLVTLR